MDSLCSIKPVVRLSCGGFSLGLLILLTGCGKRNPHAVEHAEVSGKVLFAGKPLPGGRITFRAANGTFAASEVIDENGNYKISAPVGDVKIAVDNTMLRMKGKGGGPPKGMKAPRPPGAEKEAKPITGRYVNIPSQFMDPDASGLTYTVTGGAQTHDVELSDKPGSTPGAPGS